MCFIAGAPIASLLRIDKILVPVPDCHWLGDPWTTLHVCDVESPNQRQTLCVFIVIMNSMCVWVAWDHRVPASDSELGAGANDATC